MTRVFSWMTFGLLITAIVAYVVGNDPALIRSLLGGGLSVGAIFILQFGLVLFMSFGINKMSVATATFCFLLYSFTMGITTSVIYMVYTSESISQIFLITAAMFAGLAFYGAVTKKDLSGFGTFLFMGLLGGLVATVINFWVHSSGLNMIVSYLFVFIFAGLTVYDTQRIKSFARMGDTESDVAHKMAIMGALALYLDFINLFLQLLRLMGDRRRN